ncbi:hypothetical protein BC332_07991 [Capsicum chinense]|nr:hypothetical protein BC332_07991 [Capsicum chinense]
MFGIVVDGSPILLEGSTDLGIVVRRQMMHDLIGWEPPLDRFCGIRRILVSILAAYIKELDNITDDTPKIEVWAWEHIIPLQPTPYPLGVNHHEASAPLARKWRRGIVHVNEARNILVIIRDVLDNLTIEQAMGHETIYRMAQLVLDDPRATSEIFAPNYAPPTQSAESPPVQVRRQGRQSASRDSTHQGRRSGRRADRMSDRGKKPHNNFGLSLATTTEAYYPTFEFGEPSTAVTNFSLEEIVGFIMPPIVQYDFAQLSEFHHAPQPGIRDFFMYNSPFTKALSFSDVSW